MADDKMLLWSRLVRKGGPEPASTEPPLALCGYRLTVGCLSARFRDDGCQPKVGAWAASQRTSAPVCGAMYCWVFGLLLSFTP